MIRAEKKASPLPCPCGDGFKEVDLQNAVLVMTLFWPRIGEEDPNFIESCPGRKRAEEFASFALREVTVVKARAGAFPLGPGDAVAADVDAIAKFPGMLRRVASEEVAVTAADFPDDFPRCNEMRCEFLPQRGTAAGDLFDKSGIKWHAPLR